ncbi:MAG: MBL fold metallo-hydrolase [Actinomycetota bacterium]|nr:MBL fold metallo-hydrolase [Actinomycetota bacterium]
MINNFNMFYGNDVVNSIFIQDEDSLVIVDTGVLERKQELLDEIAKQHYEKLFIVITHAHADHIGNNFAIKEKFNPVFISNIYSKGLLEDYEFQYDQIVGKAKDEYDVDASTRSWYFGLIDQAVSIDIAFYDQMELNLGNRQFQIMHLPGHTVGDLGIIDKENKLLIVSELIFKHSREMIIYIEDYKGYLESLDKIEALVNDYSINTMLTAHEQEPICGKDNILDIIDYNRQYINKLKDDYQKLYQQNKSLRETAAQICDMYSKSYTFDSVITGKALLGL